MRSTILAMVLVLAAALPAAAQDDRAVAQTEFEAGERAFEAHDYQVALGHFRRAFELAPHDAVRFNIAVCYERLARFRAALHEYDAASQSTELDEDWRGRAREQGDRIRPWLATLVVEGPPGALVLVEGEERCAIPCRVDVDPRELVVTVRAREEQTYRVAPERGAVETVTVVEAPLPETPPVAVDAGGDEGARIASGVLIALGAVATAAGGIGVGYFGVRANDLHAEFERTPTEPLAVEGEQMRDLANGSIGLLVGGALLVVVDAIIFATSQPHATAPVTVDARGVSLRF